MSQKPTTARELAHAGRPCGTSRCSPRRHAVGDEPAERRERLAATASKTSPPAISKTTSTCSPRLASTMRSFMPSGDASIAASAPSSSASARFSSRRRGGDHAAGAHRAGRAARRASRRRRPPRGRRRSRPAAPRARPVEVPRGQALEQQRQRGAVVDAVGDREGQRAGRGRVLRVAAVCRRARRRARPVSSRTPATSAAGDQRQRRPREVGVVALVRVGEVQARAARPGSRTSPVAGLRDRACSTSLRTSGRRTRLLDRAHAPSFSHAAARPHVGSARSANTYAGGSAAYGCAGEQAVRQGRATPRSATATPRGRWPTSTTTSRWTVRGDSSLIGAYTGKQEVGEPGASSGARASDASPATSSATATRSSVLTNVTLDGETSRPPTSSPMTATASSSPSRRAGTPPPSTAPSRSRSSEVGGGSGDARPGREALGFCAA